MRLPSLLTGVVVSTAPTHSYFFDPLGVDVLDTVFPNTPKLRPIDVIKRHVAKQLLTKRACGMVLQESKVYGTNAFVVQKKTNHHEIVFCIWHPHVNKVNSFQQVKNWFWYVQNSTTLRFMDGTDRYEWFVASNDLYRNTEGQNPFNTY